MANDVVELVGGPRDGEVRAASPGTKRLALSGAEMEPAGDQRVFAQVTYRDTGRTSPAGRRLFEFVPLRV